jgi:hypothetical protein
MPETQVPNSFAVYCAERSEESATINHTISLSPAEQLALWKALEQPEILTAAQQQLSRVMRGETNPC